MTTIKLYEGNCLDVLRKCPDNFVDSIVTDPPYGLSFMGKAWDYQVPTTDIWKECLRVLKPGGHLLAFGGTRTYHRLVVNIEDAGFEIRDQIMWIYGSGFPKSMDISKAIDKEAGVERELGPTVGELNGRNTTNHEKKHEIFAQVNGWDKPTTVPTSEDAKRWSGYGTALKPANEPICLARKPLSEKTVAKNVLKHGVGGLNIEASRIPMAEGDSTKRTIKTAYGLMHGDNPRAQELTGGSDTGRFPANILFDEAAAAVLDEQAEATSRFFYVAKASKKDRNTGLKENFAVWENLDQSQVATAVGASAQLKVILGAMTLPADDTEWNMYLYGNSTPDNQSQQVLTCTTLTALKTTIESKTLSVLANLNTKENIQDAIETLKASGLNLADSAAFINQFELNTMSESMESLLDVVSVLLLTLSNARKQSGNFHATVKPIKLMEYLVKLVTPEGGIVLDPFMGSGTTGVACKNLGFGFRGVEMTKEYFDIASNRILTKELEDAG